jgi:hypothetical protein
MGYFAIFLLNKIYCCTDVRHLILNIFITLCKDNNNIKKIVDMSAENNHSYSGNYWCGNYFLEKFNIFLKKMTLL